MSTIRSLDKNDVINIYGNSDWINYLKNDYIYSNSSKLYQLVGEKHETELKSALNGLNMQCNHCEIVEKSKVGPFYRFYFKDSIGAALFKVFENNIIQSITDD